MTSAGCGATCVAGLTAAAVVVPQAMAYAAIAGLPLVVGLYTALVPLVVYAVMGSSRPLSVTTTSTIAILTASALHLVAPNGSNEALIDGHWNIGLSGGGHAARRVRAANGSRGQLHFRTGADRIQGRGRTDHRGGSDSQAARSEFSQGSFLPQPRFHRESSAAGVRADDSARAGHAGAATRLAAVPAPRAGLPRHRGHGHRRLRGWPD